MSDSGRTGPGFVVDVVVEVVVVLVEVVVVVLALGPPHDTRSSDAPMSAVNLLTVRPR